MDFEAILRDLENGQLTGPVTPTLKTPRKQGAVTGGPVTQALKPLLMSAHSILWSFELEGEPKRPPFSEYRMRGLIKRTWHFKGAVLIANIGKNKSSLDLWMVRGKQPNPEKMLYDAWSRADCARRDFSLWQQVALKPRETGNIADIARLHAVTESPDLNAVLIPPNAPRRFIGLNSPYSDAVLTGAQEDGSHPGKMEMIGPESARGTLGLDWILTKLPAEFEEMKAAIGLIEGENRATAQAIAKLARRW